MSTKSPAFQWYPKDILSSKRVALMTLAEEGAYRRAIDFCWLHGSLPTDLSRLSMLIGKNCTPKIAATVKGMFIEENGELRHDRLDAERVKQEIWREKCARGGKKSASKRATVVELPLQQPLQVNGQVNGNSPVSSLLSPSPINTKIQTPVGDDEKNLKQKIPKPEVKVELPWAGEEFTAAWQNWKNFRAREKHIKFKTSESELAQLKRLSDLALGDEKTAIQIIKQSIGNQWQGLFQLSNNNNNKINTQHATGNNNTKTPLWRR